MGARSPPPPNLPLSSLNTHKRAGSLSPLPSFVGRPPRRLAGRVVAVVVLIFVLGLLTFRGEHVTSLLPARSDALGATSAAVSLSRAEYIATDPETFRFTTYDGGVPGYSAFSNLYLMGGVLSVVTPDAEAAASIPSARAVLSGPPPAGGGGRPGAGEDRWTTFTDASVAAAHFGPRVQRIPGVTYLFNDEPGKGGYMAFWEHFITEIFLPAARTIAAAASKNGEEVDPRSLLPGHIMFPRCGASPSWRDDKGANLWLLQHAVPNAVVEDATQWKDRAASDIGYVFDRIVIVDRSSAHSDQRDMGGWGKMNILVPTLKAPTHFWDPFRQNVIESIPDAMPLVGKYKLPVVVYVDRPRPGMISPETHEAIVKGLKKLTPRAEIHVAKLYSMKREQLIALFSRASIVVGLSANDLYESVWMTPGHGATVIELFEEGGFQRDVEVFVNMLNLNYLAIQNDQVFNEAQWKAHGRQRGPQKGSLVDLDANLVVRMVDIHLNRLK